MFDLGMWYRNLGIKYLQELLVEVSKMKQNKDNINN